METMLCQFVAARKWQCSRLSQTLVLEAKSHTVRKPNSHMERSHVRVFWQTNLAEVPADSQHQIHLEVKISPYDSSPSLGVKYQTAYIGYIIKDFGSSLLLRNNSWNKF